MGAAEEAVARMLTVAMIVVGSFVAAIIVGAAVGFYDGDDGIEYENWEEVDFDE